MIISCLADDMKKAQSNHTKTDHKVEDMKPTDSKTKTDAKMGSDDAKSKSMDPKMMDHKASGEPKSVDPKMMDHKAPGADPKMMAGAMNTPGESKSMESKMMDFKAHGESKAMDMAAPNGPHGQPKNEMQKSKDDMKVEASVGLGFYAGVVPVGYGGYGGYGRYGGYGYGYPAYYRSYYPRSYYGKHMLSP